MKELTIGQMRAFLDALEAKWTDEDTMYLGEFTEQSISVWPKAGHYAGGYSNCSIQDTAYGIMVFPVDPV